MEFYILKYWLEAFFGVICFFIGLGGKWLIARIKKANDADDQNFEDDIVCKVINQLEQEEQEQEQEVEQSLNQIMEEIKELKEIMSFQDEELKKHLIETNDNLNTVKEALLSSYKKEFYAFCKEIIDKGFISLEEHKELIKLHNIYEKLGGNGNGTMLFEKIMKLKIK